MQMNKVLLTQAGYDKLNLELTSLKDRQTHLITQIEVVAQPDESGEDGLASQLKEELEVINDKIDKIEETFEVCQIITGTPTNKNIVQVGSSVKIRYSTNLEKDYIIVSHMESDPTQNKISDQSPLGQALIGKKINDEVEFQAPVGKITYKIVSIN